MPLHYNDNLDDPLLFERCETFAGGMDGFTRAGLLLPNQAQVLENVVVEDSGTARTRQGALTLSQAGGGTAPTGGAIAAMVYTDFPILQVGDGHRERLFAAVGHTVFALAQGGWMLPCELAHPGTVTCMAVGGSWAYALNGYQWNRTDAAGQSNAWTELGTNAGTLTSDPPARATLACWHTFRMFATGDQDNPDTIWVSNLGEAGNGAWNHAQFSFRVGNGEGDDIMALCPLQGFWLFVGKADSIYAVNCDPTAASAADWTIRLQTRGVGVVGPRAVVQFGNDVLFLARDGIRSLQKSSGVPEDFNVTPPLSLPVQPYINRINWLHAHTACAHHYKQYALFAIPIDGATSPNCVLVWNGRTQAWMGVWTGWAPTCWATTRFGQDSLGTLEKLVFGHSTRTADGHWAGVVKVWQDYGIEADSTYQDDGAPVLSLIRSRGFLFGEPVNAKALRWGEWRFEASKDVTLRWYVDGVKAPIEFAETLELVLNSLPLTLPFTLATNGPKTLTKSLKHVGTGNELYCEVANRTGKLALKNMTFAAYLETLTG